MHNLLRIPLFWSRDLKSYYVIGLLTDDPSLVGEPPSRVRSSVSFQIFITNYHSNKRKVRLLLANFKVSLNKVRPYWLIDFLKKLVLPDYTLKYAVRELKLGHSQEAFPIFSSC